MSRVDLKARPRTLLIDLDGTLLGNHALPLQLDFIVRTGKALRSKRPGTSWLRALRILGKIQRELEQTPQQLTQGVTNQRRAAEIFGRAFEIAPQESDAIYLRFLSELFPPLKRHFYPIRSARAFLDWAAPEFELVLATNPVWPVELVHLRLQWGGIDPAIFKLITHAGIMHETKPSPGYYKETLAHAGREPNECLLVGNELKMDLPAARVGIPVYILSKHRPPRSLKVPSTWTPSSTGTYSGLRAILEKLEKPA